MTQITLQVSGMSCQHCVQSIENALKRIGAQGRVDLQGHSVTVEYDESAVSLAAVKEAIESQGYDVA